MMRKLPWILLALSILFNFAFTGGLLEARSSWKAAEQPQGAARADLVAERLDLDAQQRADYEKVRSSFAEKSARLRAAVALAREDQRAELAAGACDPEKLVAIEANIAELQGELRLLAAEHAREFMTTLRPEQRQAWGAWFHGRQPVHSGIPEPLKRFDVDGDGRLSPTEREAARERLRSRLAPGSGAWQLMLRRFDTDGDGTLSEQEREVARKAWFQRFPASRPDSRPRE